MSSPQLRLKLQPTPRPKSRPTTRQSTHFLTTPKATGGRGARLFASPAAAGRRILCGFSYLQRVGKGASTALWFPPTLQERLAERIAAGDTKLLDEFGVEWAAVRQFELLRDGDNLLIDDLEVENIPRSFQRQLKMRGGGYRVTLITLGRYDAAGGSDDLAILDRRLQQDITQLIHMLYLEEQSSLLSAGQQAALRQARWRVAEALPHIDRTQTARQLFGRTALQDELTRRFFQILELLPQRHITHGIAVCLTLPDMTKEKNWIYCAKREYTHAEFHKALASTFAMFGDAVADAGPMPAMSHLRGYGDHMREARDTTPN